MLKLTGYELYKIITKRGLLLLFLIILNCVLQFISLDVKDITKPDKYVYGQFFKAIDHMSNDEKYDYISGRYNLLQKLFFYQFDPEVYLTDEEQSLLENEGYMEYTDALTKEYLVFSYFYEDISNVKNYDGYLDEIQERGESLMKVSILANEDSFSYKNIIKTMEDYAHLKGIELSYDTSLGIKTATQFIPSDIILAIMIIIVCLMLISFEKDNRLFELVKTMPKGRTALITSKICTLFILTTLFVFLVFGLNLAIGHSDFGLGDLDRPLQSVSGFLSSPFQISTGTYLILFLLMKIGIFLTVSIVILSITIIVHNSLYIYAGIAGLFGISSIMFFTIDPTSPLSPLKYINLIPFIRTDMLFYEYININFFNNPINIIPCFIIFTVILFITGILISLFNFINQKKIYTAKNTYTLKSGSTVNIYLHEAWKMLFSYKTAMLILIMVVGNIWWAAQYKDYPDIDEINYRAYMADISGNYSTEKEQRIIEEREKFNGLILNMANLNRNEQWYLQKQKAFERIEQRNSYIKAYMGQHIVTPWFVYDRGYNILTAEADHKEDLKLALIYGIMLIVCLAPIMSIEYQSKTIYIIRTCSSGRFKFLNIKLLISIIAAFILYLVVYIPQYINIHKFYGFENIIAPITSLPQFENFNSGITILHYLIALNITRVIGGVVAVLIILTLSKRSMINTMLLSSVIILLPILLSLANLNFCEFIPTVALLTGNVALRNHPYIYVLFTVLMITVFYAILLNQVIRIKSRIMMYYKTICFKIRNSSKSYC